MRDAPEISDCLVISIIPLKGLSDGQPGAHTTIESTIIPDEGPETDLLTFTLVG